jgi:predicted ABC-type ATPase
VREIVILGGPNGAGKTTAARKLLPKLLAASEYLNADEIAREISPDDVDSAAFAAGRELLLRMRRLVNAGCSFALETTCSGKSYIPLLRECRQAGWRILLFYFWLPSPEASLARIARRVSLGGHGVPEEAVYRRFRSGLRNMLDLYLPLADEAEIYDNSEQRRLLVAVKRGDATLVIYAPEIWSRMQEAKR